MELEPTMSTWLIRVWQYAAASHPPLSPPETMTKLASIAGESRTREKLYATTLSALLQSSPFLYALDLQPTPQYHTVGIVAIGGDLLAWYLAQGVLGWGSNHSFSPMLSSILLRCTDAPQHLATVAKHIQNKLSPRLVPS